MGLGTEEAVVEVEEMEEEEGAEAGDEFELLSAEAAEEGSPGADMKMIIFFFLQKNNSDNCKLI